MTVEILVATLVLVIFYIVSTLTIDIIVEVLQGD